MSLVDWAGTLAFGGAFYLGGWWLGRWARRRHWARVAREEAESAASYKGADGHE
jgi:hypothetical protein